MKLLEALESCTAEDAVAIRSEITRLQGRIAMLQKLERVLAEKFPPSGGTVLAKPARAATGNTPPPRSQQQDRRVHIARYLRKNGPTKQSELMKLFTIPNGSITDVIKCDWFDRQSDGIHLTTAGRIAIDEDAQAA